jgi:hypothetical protein
MSLTPSCNRLGVFADLGMRTTIDPSAPWLIAASVLALLVVASLVWIWRNKRQTAAPAPLPREWALAPRPVFSADERRIYRLLREAFPHHVVLSKLPLVRFSQPNDPQEVRYWYEMLGAIHVTFAVCSTNGRVLAAIDLANERGSSRRSMQIKQSVLAVCRVRYLRCPIDDLPSIAELQLLVPHAAVSRAPQPAPMPLRAPAAPSATGRTMRPRNGLWQDSGFFHDSFFAPEPRLDSGHGSLDGAHETAHLDRGQAQQNSNFGELSNPGVRPAASATGNDPRPAKPSA